MVDKTDNEGVYPESGFRLPLPINEGGDPEIDAVYDKVTVNAVHPGVGLRGPTGIALHSPGYAKANSRLASYLKFDTGIDPRTRELAILVTARAMESSFEWAAHEPMALDEGLEPSIIDVVRHLQDVGGLGERDAAVIRLGREMITDRRVSKATFDTALRLFGRQKLVDLVALMTNYMGIAGLLCAFGVKPGDGRAPSPWG